MTTNKIKNILSNYFNDAGIEVNNIKIKGFKDNEINKLEISLDGLSIFNILEEISIILNVLDVILIKKKHKTILITKSIIPVIILYELFLNTLS